MYSRHEAQALRQEFWTTFGQWSGRKRRGQGLKPSWLLNHSGIRGWRFRFSHEGKVVGVHLDLIEKDLLRQEALLERMEGLRSLFGEAAPDEMIWDSHPAGDGSPLISITKEGLTPMNRAHWPGIFGFFYDNMMALESTFVEYRDILEP